MEKVGKDGVITVEEGKTLETSHEFVEACSLIAVTCRRISSPTAEDGSGARRSLHLDPREKGFSNKDLIPVLEKVLNAGKAILIIAEEIEAKPWRPW